MSEATKILHVWTVEVEREQPVTAPETIDGQVVSVTRQVKKPVVTKMALKQPTRREMRQAEFFYGKEYNRFVSNGFLQRSILINKHLDLTGGILSEKERSHISKLLEKQAGLESDLITALNEPEEAKIKIQAKLAAIRMEIQNLNSANEAIFSQTAEAKAQNQLNQWFAFNLILVDRAGKWVPYFEGDKFEDKEEFMFNLEETNDEFYQLAIQKILTYTHFFNMGANKPEQFKLIDEELAKEAEKKRLTEEAAFAPIPETSPVTPQVTPQVTPEATPQVEAPPAG